jgi:hypothetical protein
MSVSFQSIGSINTHMQITTYLNLQKDVGTVKQKTDMVLTMDGKLTYEGETVVMEMNMTSVTDLLLSSFTQNAVSGTGKLKAASGKDVLSNLPTESGLLPQQVSKILKMADFLEKLLF